MIVLAVLLIFSSATIFSLVKTAIGQNKGDLEDGKKYHDVEDEVEGYKWKSTDDSMLYLYDDGYYVWYKSDSDHTDNYFKGTYFIYENEEAIEYIDEKLAKYGITAQEQFDLIDRSSASYYTIENYVLLGLNCTERYINGEAVYSGLGLTPYYGFYNENLHYLDIANMKTASYVGFYRNEDL